jgi:diguanylate cyclase (GGDEF)-like protein
MAMIGECRVVRVAKDEILPRPQGADACMHIVLSGALSNTSTNDVDGKPTFHNDTILPGESVGELSVLDGALPTNTLKALQDSHLLVIDAATLWLLIEKSNGVARNLLRRLAFRLRTANAQLRRHEKVGNFYRQLSMVDGLTGLYNRAWLNEQLPDMIAKAHATHSPLSLILIDLDHFKQFNDSFGHLEGDHALRTMATTLHAALRPSDFAVRYGGEEILVILPDSPPPASLAVAHRLCECLRHTKVLEQMQRPLPHITASLGVATLAPHQDADALIAQADAALYRAKNAGRNQVMH